MKQKIKGSVLAYTLIILFVMLTIALAMSAVAIKGRNSAMTTGDSVQAFQTANTGSEIFLKEYKGATMTADVSSLKGTVFDCDPNDNFVAKGGSVGYSITLKDSSGVKIDCSGSGKVSDIAKIQVNGSYGGTTRAIEVAMAAGPVSGSITGGCEFGARWGTASSCPALPLNNPGIICDSGNTPHFMAWYLPSGVSNNWNSNGAYATGFCIKD